MKVAHTARIHIAKHEGPHRTARIDGFDEPIHFSVHGGIKAFYGAKYGTEIDAPKYPATLEYIVAGVGG